MWLYFSEAKLYYSWEMSGKGAGTFYTPLASSFNMMTFTTQLSTAVANVKFINVIFLDPFSIPVTMVAFKRE